MYFLRGLNWSLNGLLKSIKVVFIEYLKDLLTGFLKGLK